MTVPRPRVPLKVQLAAALIQLGLDPDTCELDHNPALARRRQTEDGGYDPPANDPHHLKWLDKAPHRIKTSGTKATSYGSDVHEIAKTRRLTKEQVDFCRRVLERPCGEKRQTTGRFPKGRKIQSRPFRRRGNPYA